VAELECKAVYPLAAKDLGSGMAEYHSFEDIEVVEESEGILVEIDMEVELTIHYKLPLQGAIQLQNSALAIATIQLLRQQDWPVETEDIVNGIAKTRWPGRLQWLTWEGQQILIDGAHNPASAAVLRQFVDSLHPPGPIHWVMGMLSTKDHDDIFSALLRPGDSLCLVPVPDHSSADPEALVDLALDVCPELSVCKTYPDLVAALRSACANQPASQNVHTKPLVALSGSLYLIGHFLQLVNETTR
jgi:dihydrofolate synthase/folylpolyglutamate synthase